MIVYASYTLFFLFLLLWKKKIRHAFCFTEKDTKLILMGLAVYCASYVVSSALIEFGLKVDTYRFFSHHAILLAACVLFYVKMIRTDDT
jgi:hypothetical protein